VEQKIAEEAASKNKKGIRGIGYSISAFINDG